jgi:hypothetical protein
MLLILLQANINSSDLGQRLATWAADIVSVRRPHDEFFHDEFFHEPSF